MSIEFLSIDSTDPESPPFKKVEQGSFFGRKIEHLIDLAKTTSPRDKFLATALILMAIGSPLMLVGAGTCLIPGGQLIGISLWFSGFLVATIGGLGIIYLSK